jgi:hypothetical protein
VALLLVAVVWSAKHVTGLTDGSAQYTVYGLAIALAAIAGGLAPGIVATMTAVLLVNADAPASVLSAGHMTFAIEGLGLAMSAGWIRRRLDQASAQLTSAEHANLALTEEVRQARISHDAFEHLVAMENLARRRETEAFKEAELQAQMALQRAADEARAQVETLEALTDPAVSVVAGTDGVDDLLGRLRAALRAEGVALVRVGRASTRVVASAGLQPAASGKPGGPMSAGIGEGRIALVHNDAARVAQVSAVQWPPTVSSILVVPVRSSGPVAFRMEVVNERRAPATEWDLALARIVADRLASARVLHAPVDSADAVA